MILLRDKLGGRRKLESRCLLRLLSLELSDSRLNERGSKRGLELIVLRLLNTWILQRHSVRKSPRRPE